VKPGDAFREGVRRGLSGTGITSELFEVRARFLLGKLNASDGASMVSGLLIGEDVRVGLKENEAASVIVMGRPELTILYTAALEVAGAQSEPLDGEGAFIAGARNIVEQMQ
jgi:2-dehydro-3-deoxygalactonokinase